MWTSLLLIFLSLCVGLGAWLFFLWAVKSGQYDDVEGPKYRMLEDDSVPKEEGQKGDEGRAAPGCPR